MAKIACGVVFSALAYLPMLGVALVTGKLPLDTGADRGHERRALVGLHSVLRLGLMIGTLVKGSAAPGYANLIYLPGCYLSGLFFPLPASMYWQAPIWPQFHVDAARHALPPASRKFQLMPVQFASATLSVSPCCSAPWRSGDWRAKDEPG